MFYVIMRNIRGDFMSNNQFNNLYDYNDELFKAISINHYMIGKIDLLNEEVLILQSIDRPDSVQNVYNWYDFFKPYLDMILENKNYHVFFWYLVKHY